MALEHKLEAREIVSSAGMSARPEFYSGRGAITDDLTGQKLEKIYEQKLTNLEELKKSVLQQAFTGKL